MLLRCEDLSNFSLTVKSTLRSYFNYNLLLSDVLVSCLLKCFVFLNMFSLLLSLKICPRS
jgi:hypothetical protein